MYDVTLTQLETKNGRSLPEHWVGKGLVGVAPWLPVAGRRFLVHSDRPEDRGGISTSAVIEVEGIENFEEGELTFQTKNSLYHIEYKKIGDTDVRIGKESKNAE